MSTELAAFGFAFYLLATERERLHCYSKDLQNKYFSMFFGEITVFPTLFAGTVFVEK